MKVSAFLHADQDSPTTLSEIKRIHKWASTEDYLGLYAYATQSGASAFHLALGEDFWTGTPSRWLFGIDYGRTQPEAIRHISEKPNAQVRIYDGAWIVKQNGFLPRRDFHAKTSLLLNPSSVRFGIVVGSGNFSSNGLRKSIEAGATLQANDKGAYKRMMRQAITTAQQLWENATPANEILDAYEERWSASFARGVAEDQPPGGAVSGPQEIFWIEAGYVTQNRGADRPGNQIDFPRGMSRYFGFNPPDDLPKNSVIGAVTFEPPYGDPVTNNLRLGNNMMEKISLPIPETHGFDIYDGKVLVFQRSDHRFTIRALEAEDFETAFGDKLAGVKVMGSGRRYGHID